MADGVGQYSYYYTLVQYFVILGNLGFSTYGQIQIARVSDDIDKRSQTFWEIFLLRLGAFCFSSLLYLTLCKILEAEILMLILFGVMISGALDISWLLFGMDNFKSVSLRNILVKCISIAGIFLFVKSKNDTPVYTFILTASTLFGSIVIWIDIKDIIVKPLIKGLRFRQHLKPAIAFFLPNIATTIYTMADKTMIGLITRSDAQNGYYEQAHKIQQILIQFLLSIGIVYKSQMARLFEIKDNIRIHENILKAMKVVLLLSFPICFGLIAVSRDLIGCFLGEGYLQCIQLLQVFALLLIIISVSNCMSNMYLIVTDKQKMFQKGTYIGAIVNITCNTILIPNYGALGAAIASVVAEATILMVFYYYSKDYFKWTDYKSNIIRYLSASAVMIALIKIEEGYLTPYKVSSLLIEVLAGAAVYVFTLLILKDDTFLGVLEQAKKMLTNHSKR